MRYLTFCSLLISTVSQSRQNCALFSTFPFSVSEVAQEMVGSTKNINPGAGGGGGGGIILNANKLES